MQSRHRALRLGELNAFKRPQNIYPKNEYFPFVVDGKTYATLSESRFDCDTRSAILAQFETHTYIRRLVETWPRHYDPIVLEMFCKNAHVTSMDMRDGEKSERQEIERLVTQKSKIETELSSAMALITKLRNQVSEHLRSNVSMDFGTSEKFFERPKAVVAKAPVLSCGSQTASPELHHISIETVPVFTSDNECETETIEHKNAQAETEPHIQITCSTSTEITHLSHASISTDPAIHVCQFTQTELAERRDESVEQEDEPAESGNDESVEREDEPERRDEEADLMDPDTRAYVTAFTQTIIDDRIETCETRGACEPPVLDRALDMYEDVMNCALDIYGSALSHCAHGRQSEIVEKVDRCTDYERVEYMNANTETDPTVHVSEREESAVPKVDFTVPVARERWSRRFPILE